MGLDFIRASSAAFEQRRDASRNQEFDIADLFLRSQPELSNQIFQCHLVINAEIVKGERLIVRAFSESEIKVSQLGREIGFIQMEDAARLAAYLKKNAHTGILTVLITDIPDISGNFSVRPFKLFKNT